MMPSQRDRELEQKAGACACWLGCGLILAGGAAIAWALARGLRAW